MNLNGRALYVLDKFLLISFVALLFTEEIAAMRLVLQRVKSASVRVEGEIVSSIGPGVMALVGLHDNDTEENVKDCCKKLLAAKLWENDSGGQWR
jgi:D-tyrosyl-tRNA(Tyr) deacylase